MKKIALVLFALSLLATLALAAGIVLVPVESSFIAKAGYDAETQGLAIQMASDSNTYYYKGVPQSVYDGFLAAESKEDYFVEHIQGRYEEDMVQ